MAYKKSIESKKTETAVSNVFIEKYMPEADGDFVKVYLLGINQCSCEKPLSLSQMASALGLTEKNIFDAWKYWDEKGVLSFDGENIEFFDLNCQKGNDINLQTKPVYSAEEIYYCASKNKQLSELFGVVEKILSKPLSSTDLMVVYSFYDYYGLPVDVIPMLISHSVRMGKKSMKQIEKTASLWVEKEITTVETAEKYIAKSEEYIASIDRLKKIMGLENKTLSVAEKKYINSWVCDLSFSFDLVAYAYKICFNMGEKYIFSSMNKLLLNWHKSGVNNLKQAMAHQQNGGTESVKSNVAPTKFTNFDQPDFDFDSFEKNLIK